MLDEKSIMQLAACFPFRSAFESQTNLVGGFNPIEKY